MLDLRSFSFSSGGTATLDTATNVLTVTEGGSSYTQALGSSYAGEAFSLSVDSRGDTLVTAEVAPCYCAGTLILTDQGEVAVENLAVGDKVLTLERTAEPVGWIGRRSYRGRFIAGNHLILPVTIKAGALAEGVPRRDLHVSPGHALFLDGQLVPAWRLVNAVSIVQADAVDDVCYVHVALPRHAVIFAEGAQAESFLDDDCLHQFHNAGECSPEALAKAPFAQRLEDGFGLQFLRERIATRAGQLGTIDPAGPLRGYVDTAGPDRVCGWAQDMDSPEEPVALEILVGGRPVLCLLANGYRADLRQAGLGSGCHAFDVALPDVGDGEVQVRRVSDGRVLQHTEAASGSQAQRAA